MKSPIIKTLGFIAIFSVAYSASEDTKDPHGDETNKRREVSDLTAETEKIKKELITKESAARKSGEANNTTIADLAIQREELFAKRRALSIARRNLDSLSSAKAERHAFQDSLAAAKTNDERQRLIENRIALKQALAAGTKSETENK